MACSAGQSLIAAIISTKVFLCARPSSVAGKPNFTFKPPSLRGSPVAVSIKSVIARHCAKSLGFAVSGICQSCSAAISILLGCWLAAKRATGINRCCKAAGNALAASLKLFAMSWFSVLCSCSVSTS